MCKALGGAVSEKRLQLGCTCVYTPQSLIMETIRYVKQHPAVLKSLFSSRILICIFAEHCPKYLSIFPAHRAHSVFKQPTDFLWDLHRMTLWIFVLWVSHVSLITGAKSYKLLTGLMLCKTFAQHRKLPRGIFNVLPCKDIICLCNRWDIWDTAHSFPGVDVCLPGRS